MHKRETPRQLTAVATPVSSDGPRRTVIYGAGAAGIAALAHFRLDPGRTIVAFADGDARKQGTSVEGLRVVAIDGLPREWYDEVVVASQAWRDIISTLAQLGIERERISLYRPGDSQVVPAFEVSGPATMPSVLVLTDDCVSPGHGTGAVLMRHFADYPANRLSHVYLRRKGDPFWPNSYALAVGGRGEAGSLSASAVAAQLRASGQMPDVIYANVFGESGLEALGALLEALGPVPVIQHFMDWLYTDLRAFERALCAIAPQITEFWAITDALGRRISTMAGRSVRTMNPFKCDISETCKHEHRDLDRRFRAVMLGNSHMPWVLHHVRNVWRRVRDEVPGLEPIQWYGYPTSVLYVREAGVEFEPEIEYYGYLNAKALHEQLCSADLAIIPFNIADTPEYHYAEHSVPSRITEFVNAGLPIIAAAGAHTETRRFITGHDIGVCATIDDETRFTATLLDLMRDTGRRVAMSKRARAFAERHCDIRVYRQSLVSAFTRVARWQERRAS